MTMDELPQVRQRFLNAVRNHMTAEAALERRPALVVEPELFPFDHDSSDDEVRAVLHKRTVTWINRTSGHCDHATVATIYQIVRRGGVDDYITFIDRCGYHSVYLNQIVGVS